MQETTVIAELSGYKKDDIIGLLSSTKGSQKGSPRPNLDSDIINLENEFMKQHGNRLANSSNMHIIDKVLPSQILTANSFADKDISETSPFRNSKAYGKQSKRK